MTSNKELAVAFQIANPLRISLTTTESLGVTPNIPATAATISPSVLSQDRLEDPITESTNVAAAVAEDPLLSICQAATAPCKGDIKKPKMTKEDRKKLQQQRKEDKVLYHCLVLVLSLTKYTVSEASQAKCTSNKIIGSCCRR